MNAESKKKVRKRNSHKYKRFRRAEKEGESARPPSTRDREAHVFVKRGKRRADYDKTEGICGTFTTCTHAYT